MNNLVGQSLTLRTVDIDFGRTLAVHVGYSSPERGMPIDNLCRVFAKRKERVEILDSLQVAEHQGYVDIVDGVVYATERVLTHR